MFTRFLLSLPVLLGQFFQFAFIVIVVGSMAFPFGQSLPRKNFDFRRYPFKAFGWEDQGNFYLKFKIQKWKDKVPDMSKHVKSAFSKKISVFRDAEYIEMLILETCVGEFVHFVLIFISPIFLIFMDSQWAWIWMVLYIVGNIPFIMIQRYNRPRLVQILDRMLGNQSPGQRKKIAQAM